MTALVGLLTTITGTRLGRWAIAGAAILLMAYIAHRIRLSAAVDTAVGNERAQQLADQLDRTKDGLDAVKRMGDAQASGPRDRRAVLERLLAGTG